MVHTDGGTPTRVIVPARRRSCRVGVLKAAAATAADAAAPVDASGDTAPSLGDAARGAEAPLRDDVDAGVTSAPLIASDRTVAALGVVAAVAILRLDAWGIFAS